MNNNLSMLLLTALSLFHCCCCLRPITHHAASVIREGSSNNTLSETEYAAKTEELTTATLTKTNTNSSIVTEGNNGIEREQRIDRNDGRNKTMEADASKSHALQEAGDNGTKSFSIWSMMRGLWHWISTEFSESRRDGSNEMVSRTFGAIRRLQVVLIPLVFKFGFLTAMVALLVALSLKTVFLLKVLLMMNALALMGKLLSWKWRLGGSYNDGNAESIFRPGSIFRPAPAWVPNYNSWSTAPAYYNAHGSGGGHHGGWSPPPHYEQHHPSKEVHVHIHGAQLTSRSTSGDASPNSWDHRNDPYAAYQTPPDEAKHG